MPEDQRPPRSGDLSADEPLGTHPPGTGAPGDMLALLEEGDIEVEGRMPWSSNATLLVTVSLAGAVTRAIYKPAAGEQPLRDFPEGLFAREVAAYELASACGLDVVPETVLRAEGPFGTGSLQRFVDADFEQHYFSLVDKACYGDGLRRVAGFDLLANNADRKGGHLLVDADDHIWGIDNGLCFHPLPKLRTVMWDFAGEDLPESVLDACRALVRQVPDRLVPLLGQAERESLVRRAAGLLADPRFPEPDLDRRPYPWPLV